MKKLSLVLLAIISLAVQAQENKEAPKFGISFSGFVKTDIFYDTRQTVNIREGHFLLYPENVSPDANKNDINDKSTFNMLSIQSRLRGSITGPDAFGAKTSGVLEADFFGNENSSFGDLNGFRLRHAFVKLNWKTTELLVGQYWHPMFIAESFPGTVSFNTGAPFQPFSRNPQIRVSQSFGGLKLIGCLFTQRDFSSTGPEYVKNSTTGEYTSLAVASPKYMRNAAIPNAHFQVQFAPDSSEHLFGAGIDYKTLLPELYTVDYTKILTYQSTETISSLSAIAFARFKFKPVSIRIEGVYAQNAYDMAMIGGYAVQQINDSLTGAKSFTNLNTASVWLDANTNGKKIQFGLFTGYTKNLGSADNIKTKTFYARGSNIDNVYRLAPRVTFISGKFEIAFELEHTVATYGTANGDSQGRVTNDKAVSNTRGLLAFVYKF
ncbi:MAG: hypothetical protein IPM71_08110 [Bacteroidota bacterium]|nr:MAG: hypothetical protein IPM71_08110 [Bacteroidota bacterium]